jgi:pentatricopeptide repeat protein
VIAAWGRVNDWRKGLSVLAGMQKRGLEPDIKVKS